MTVPRKDIIATVLVAAAAVLYLLWAAETTVLGMDGARTTGAAVLLLGFAASATAVVPAFDQLLHGNRTYLVTVSLLGLIATAAGVHLLVTASGISLTVVMAAMVVMWLAATIRHIATTSPTQPEHSTIPRSRSRIGTG